MSGGARGGQGGRAGKAGSARKGASAGSGGQGRRKLAGKGPTPKAQDRSKHQKQADSPARQTSGVRQPSDVRQNSRGSGAARPGSARRPAERRTGARGSTPEAPELVVGKNPVLEALLARVPATALHLAQGTTADERVSAAVSLAGKAGVALLEVSRQQMDRMTAGALHQGLALQVPAYDYLSSAALLARALAADNPLVVALDGVTDPRNLGAVVRSAAAFGAQGVLVPGRRSAGMTAAAWRTSAGAAARLPVARCTNLTRAFTDYQKAGLFVVGLAADGASSLDDLELATSPLVVVVGSEGEGLGRLVKGRCDLTVSIPMSAGTESLNAGIAAAVTLAEVARRRRLAGAPR